MTVFLLHYHMFNSYRAADSKKKKSTFRITSIIDPVKNDDEDEDKTEDTEENEGMVCR